MVIAQMIDGFWFSKDMGLKYQVISVVENNVFVRDCTDDIYYEDIDVFIHNYQKFKGVDDE